MKNRLLSLESLVSCVLLLSGLTALADDKKADPTGTWTWTMPGRNGGPDRTNSLALKAADSKLTGTLTSPIRGGGTTNVDIADGKVDGDAVSFTVVRQFNGNTVTNNYSGKVADDKISGKVEFIRDGDTQSRDWSATRATETK